MNHNTGILIHGRHLQALNWEQMVWGDTDNARLGTLPTAILAALNEGVKNIILITLGTGSSHNSAGTAEAQVMKNLLIANFDDLEGFPQIKDHPQWQGNKESLRKLASDAIVDTQSQNTREELKNATELFKRNHVTKVLEVTGASHAPRCQLLQGIARAEGTIPHTQQWQLFADDIPYSNTTVSDTAVFEEPHRGDDPVLAIPGDLRPAKLFRRFYAVPPTKQESFLQEMTKLFEKYNS